MSSHPVEELRISKKKKKKVAIRITKSYDQWNKWINTKFKYPNQLNRNPWMKWVLCCRVTVLTFILSDMITFCHNYWIINSSVVASDLDLDLWPLTFVLESKLIFVPNLKTFHRGVLEIAWTTIGRTEWCRDRWTTWNNSCVELFELGEHLGRMGSDEGAGL